MKKILVMLMLVPGALSAAGIQGKPAENKPEMAMMNCPMNLQGTSVSVADTATGIAVSFTTKADNVAELRRRVEQMAGMHNAQATSAAMMQGPMMSGTVNYEAIENGAKLTFIPKDSAKRTEFRAQVRAHVEKMQKGECSMMQDMMQGMTGGMGKSSTGTKPETNSEPKKEESDVDHSQHHPAGETK